ncbi:MAG: thiamine pyrophosphate-dependent enzyme [Verrucomicrobiota bacterium]
MDLHGFAQAFVRSGGQWAFGVPGGGASLQLVDELMRGGTKFITTGHETTAALMAGAVSRLSGKPSLAVTIKGPGFMNLAPGLLSNAYEGYAHLSASEAYPRGKPGPRKHKWLDHQRVGGEFLKACRSFEDSPAFLDQCWSQACAEFPGPVHVELADGPPTLPDALTEIADNATHISAKIRAAERPVVIVGSLALRAGWRGALQQLRVPVFTTVAAKGALPETSPFAAGIYTGDGKPITPEKMLLPHADLVVAIGVRPGEVLSPDAPHANCVAIDSPTVRMGWVFPPNTFGAPRTYLSERTIGELLALLANKSWGQAEIAAAFKGMDDALNCWDWSPARVFRLAMEALPDAIHVLDTGNFTVIGEHLLRARSERDILGTPNGRFMGLGIGYALGACLNPENRPVVLWIGDGGSRAFFSELSLAVEHKMKLLVLVMRDGYFGSVRGRAQAKGWTTEPLTMRGRDLGAIARAMGMEIWPTKSENLLTGDLNEWRRKPHPMLIQCDFDNADDYVRIAELLR